jgi:hypothetical protein
MYKRFILLMLLGLAVAGSSAHADKLTGLSDVTVVDGEIISLRFEGIEYIIADGLLQLGTTTRWYIDGGVETLWPEGDPVPAAAPTVPNPSSNAKVGDVGSKADNFLFTLNGATNISSIDGINFQETVFPFLTNTFFVFERNGNDNGTVQAILADGSLGPALTLTAGGAPYASTGVDVNGQTAYGYVLTTDVPVQGIRITAEGHDTLSLSALTAMPDIATRPDPADGSIHEDTWVNLSWSPGKSAVSHDVYLGDDFSAVEEATRDSEEFRGNRTLTFYVAGFPGAAYPDGLVPGTTYYWRIDEINDADPNSPWKGDIWSFSIPSNTAYNPDPADGAEFVGPDNVILSWTPGFGAKLHTVFLGDDYDEVRNATVGMPAGNPVYRPGPLEREKVYYWRVDEFDGFATYPGDIWGFSTTGAAGTLQPTNNAVDVEHSPILTWMPAENAASHQVYFGTDKEAVKNATTASPEYKGSKAQGSDSYDPGKLDWYTSYYWRVDAVYAANTVKGLVWSFTTADFLVVDDFESYTDDDTAGQAIWQTWVDGFGLADNGAQVGYLLPPYTEQTIIHGGVQSMPLLYVNEAGVTNSEASLTLTSPRDWTAEGVGELSLWFRGGSSNAAEPLYAAVSNAAGAPAVVAHSGPAAATAGVWIEWRIPLQAFADQGINLTNVNKIAIGLGSKSGMAAAGGSGTMYIDDIRLYRLESAL